MATPFIGQIMMFGGNFAPLGWAFCDGSLQAISQNETLFALIGTTYGGDGQTTFALPDLRGRIPIHQGTGPGLSQYTIGQLGGVETVTLTAVQLGGHTHAIQANNKSGSSASPGGNIVAGTAANPYSTGTGDVNMGAATIGAAGGSQPHSNMMPFLAVSFVISLFGIFPSQN